MTVCKELLAGRGIGPCKVPQERQGFETYSKPCGQAGTSFSLSNCQQPQHLWVFSVLCYCMCSLFYGQGVAVTTLWSKQLAFCVWPLWHAWFYVLPPKFMHHMVMTACACLQV